MKLRPIEDRVIVEVIKYSEAVRRSSGLYVPTAVAEKEHALEGKVLFVGEGRMQKDGSRFPMQVKPGETVIFAQYSGSEVHIGDKTMKVLSEKDVLAVVEA